MRIGKILLAFLGSVMLGTDVGTSEQINEYSSVSLGAACAAGTAIVLVCLWLLSWQRKIENKLAEMKANSDLMHLENKTGIAAAAKEAKDAKETATNTLNIASANFRSTKEQDRNLELIMEKLGVKPHKAHAAPAAEDQE